MKNTLFLSDVHLDVSPRGQERMNRFIAFLRAIDPAKTERLLVLGDLFDFWFEYRHVIFSGYFDVLRAFADLRDHGVALELIGGNHDFWAGRFLEQHLGFTVHSQPVTQTIGPHRVLFAHGDGINPTDHGYRIYKRIARARIVIAAFRMLHPDWAMALAQGVSRGSRRLTQAADLANSAESRALRSFAHGVIERGGADAVMCGHAHYPVLETVQTPNHTGLYMNTGDWIHHQSHIEWDGDQFILHGAPGKNPAPPSA